MKDFDFGVEIGEFQKSQQLIKKILKAVQKLNPTHVIRQSVSDEIVLISSIISIRQPVRKAIQPACNLNTVEKELANIQLAIKKLQEAFNVTHVTTNMAMVQSGVHIRKYETFLCSLTKEVDQARIVVEQLKKKHPEWISKKWGRPKKEGLLRLTEILANEYYLATNNIPTISINAYSSYHKAYGKFLDLVQQMFDALEIKTRPDAMTRKAINMWREKNNDIIVAKGLVNLRRKVLKK